MIKTKNVSINFLMKFLTVLLSNNIDVNLFKNYGIDFYYESKFIYNYRHKYLKILCFTIVHYNENNIM